LSSNPSGSNGVNGNGNGLSHGGSLFPNGQQQEITLQDILEKIYRRKNLVIISFLVIFTLTVLYTFLQRPTFEAVAQVLIQKSKGGSNSLLEGMGDVLQPFESDERRITNEMDILQTNLLRTNVANQLLASPVITIGGKADTMETIRMAAEALRKNPNGSTLLDVVKGSLFKSVSFSNDRNSDIISIAVRSHSPEESSHIADVYTKEYYDLNLSSSRDMATNVREFLGGQLADTKKDLDNAENNLQSYMQSQGIVSLDDESKQLIEVMSSFEAQRDDVIIAERSNEEILHSYKDQLAKIEPAMSANISDAIDPYIALLQDQIAKLQVNRDVALAQNPTVGNKSIYNQIVAQADSQIAELQRKLKEKTAKFLEGQILSAGSPQSSQGGGASSYDPTGYYKQLKLQILQEEIQLSSIQAQRKEFDNIVGRYSVQFSKLPKQTIQLAELDRTKESKEKLFLLVQDSYQQAQIAEQSQFGYVQIVDPAVPPEKPVTPKIPLNLTLGLLLGLAFGIGLVFVLDYVDRSIKSPEDLERRGLNVLGSIPVMAGTVAATKAKGTKAEERVMKEGQMVPMRLITYHKPTDPIAEAYRSLRTAIQYSRIDRPIRSLLVASALPKEGKSTTTANIAITMAKAGLKTLIVDGDLRRPVLHRLFNCDRKPGLIEYLKDEIDLNTAIRKTFVENLFLLPTGSLPPNPAEVLGSDKMKATLEILKASFDFVIFDSPPVVAVTDGVVVSKLTDGVLLVTLANKTELDVLEKAYSTLKQVKADVIGFVVNEFDVTKAYGAYYRYYRYYHYYGHKEETKGTA
jgi:tyrosine-protein kinase Etk/Wzc